MLLVLTDVILFETLVKNITDLLHFVHSVFHIVSIRLQFGLYAGQLCLSLFLDFLVSLLVHEKRLLRFYDGFVNLIEDSHTQITDDLE